MRTHVLHREQRLDGTPAEVFPFFADARNLEAITPPLLRFRVVTPGPLDVHAGTFLQYRLRVHGIPVTWHTIIQEWDPPHRFVDVQVRGPYALWHHTHTFAATGDHGTLMTDTVRYAIGFGPLGALAHRVLVRRDVEAIFAFRARRVPELLLGVRGGGALAGGADRVEAVEDEVRPGEVAG
jgi:ligand-binding SRPBCC domain-containing protein